MTAENKPILCVGLNPAYQKVYNLRRFALGTVNRIYKITEAASGKGINVARVLQAIQKPAIVTGFLGGHTGEFIIKDLNYAKLSHRFAFTKNKTRTCITLITDGESEATELVEEGDDVSVQEVQDYIDMYNKMLPECGLVVISGTAPPGVPDDIYYHLIKKANELDIPAVVDTQKNFLWNALRAHAVLVKPNLHELETALDRKLQDNDSTWKAIDELIKLGMECVVISNEGNATFVAYNKRRLKIIPPKVTTINAIGSGDAFTAGIAAALLDNKEIIEAVVYGTACGTASTLTPVPGFVNPEQIQPLVSQVQVIPQ